MISASMLVDLITAPKSESSTPVTPNEVQAKYPFLVDLHAIGQFLAESNLLNWEFTARSCDEIAEMANLMPTIVDGLEAKAKKHITELGKQCGIEDYEPEKSLPLVIEVIKKQIENALK